MHGPNYGFVAFKDFPNPFQRQHALVYPAEMYDVSLLEFPCLCNVGAGIGDIYEEEVVAFEM